MVGGETLYCAIVWGVKGGSGVPKQRGCLRIIVLIRVRRLRTNRISCKGQVVPVWGRRSCLNMERYRRARVLLYVYVVFWHSLRSDIGRSSS